MLLFLAISVFADPKPVDHFLKADLIEYKTQDQTIIATGNIKLLLDGYELHADLLVYDMVRDELFCYGNIVTYNKKGVAIAYGNKALLKPKSQQAVIESFVMYFAESDAILAARLAGSVNNNHQYLQNVIYTSCPLCSNGRTLWRIKAKTADLDRENQKVSYHDALFEIYNIPVLYIPYFEHATPNAPAKSGLLLPSLKHNKAALPVYFRVQDNLDLTLTALVGKLNPTLATELRHVLSSGGYNAILNVTATDRKELRVQHEAGNKIFKWRYFLNSEGNFREGANYYGFGIKRASDKSYYADYYDTHESYLLSSAYFHHTSQENFFNSKFLAFQGVSSEDKKNTDPIVLPEINWQYIIASEANPNNYVTISNYSSVINIPAFGLKKQTSLQVNAQMSTISSSGHILSGLLYNRADLLETYANANDEAALVRRYIPELHLGWRYPLLVKTPIIDTIIEPIVKYVQASKSKKWEVGEAAAIENFEYDDTNVFNSNKYSNLRYHEYGPRLLYGLNSYSSFWQDYQAGFFIGQMKRFSTANHALTDIVGRSMLQLPGGINISYRFRKNPKSFKSSVDEYRINYVRFNLNSNVGLIKLAKTDTNSYPNIRQVYFNSSYQFNEEWGFGVGGRVDFSHKQKTKVIERSMIVTYTGKCASISAKMSNDYTVDSNRYRNQPTNYSFAINLKTLDM